MATLTKTTRSANPFQAAINALSASDVLVYTPKKNQVLHLTNTTASPVNVTIDGSTASAAYPIPGTGGKTVDLSTGKVITVPGVIGAMMVVPLDNMSNFLQGTIAVTGGVGVNAVLLSD